jgi:hypothetical protein
LSPTSYDGSGNSSSKTGLISKLRSGGAQSDRANDGKNHKDEGISRLCVVSSADESKLAQLGSCTETGDSQRGREAVNTEVEGSTALGAVTRQRLVKTQQTEKT